MKCERIRELVSDALDGVLAPRAADRFHAHLDACPPCRTYYMELKESLLLLEELPVLEVGEDFDRAVWSRIRTEEEPLPVLGALGERLEMLRVRFSFGTGLLRWSPAFAAAAVLFAVAVMSPPGVDSSGGTGVAVAIPDTQQGDRAAGPPQTGASSLRSEDGSEEDDLEAGDPGRPRGFREQEYVSGMPRAVEHHLENGQELRLTNSDRYEHSTYSYPLRQFPDPELAEFPVGSNGSASGFSWRHGAETVGTPVGTAASPASSEHEVRVMVLEF